jgi:hypothetical protein
MKYSSIDSVFKRDMTVKRKPFLNEYATPTLEMLANAKWYATEKVDGTNIRIYPDGTVKGRTDDAQLHVGLLTMLQEIAQGYAQLVEQCGMTPNILFGEGYGQKVQGNLYGLSYHAFTLFDVYNPEQGIWYNREAVNGVADSLGLAYVPTLASNITLPDAVEMIKTNQFKDSRLHNGAPNEGYVLRPMTELRTNNGSRVITKLKFRDKLPEGV